MSFRVKSISATNFLIKLCILFIPVTIYTFLGLKISEILMIIALFVYLLESAINKDMAVTIKIKLLKRFVFLFCIVILASNLYNNFLSNEVPIGVDQGIYYSYEYGFIFKIIRLIILFLFCFLVIKFVASDKHNLKVYSNIYLFSTTLMCLYSTFDMVINKAYNFGVDRTSLLCVEPSEAAFLTSFSILYLIYINIEKINFKYLGLLIVHLLGYLHIGSLGSFIALFFSIIMCSLLYFFNGTKNKKKYLILFFIIIIMAVLIGFKTNLFLKLGMQYDNISGGSKIERLSATDAGMKMFNNHKLLGIGIGNYGWLIANYNDNPLFHIEPGGKFSANNEYVVLLSELGVLGICVFISFVFFVLIECKKLIKNRDTFNNIYTKLAINLFIYVLTNMVTMNLIFSFPFWLSLAYIYGIANFYININTTLKLE